MRVFGFCNWQVSMHALTPCQTNMIHIALLEPEIPPNTGNIIRLCANTGMTLHVIKPLGFPLDDKRMRRAGLDYHEFAEMRVHENYQAFQQSILGQRIIACETVGQQRYDQMQYQVGDVLLFGSETRGLPQSVLEELPGEHIVRLPMKVNSRSLNLSNSVAIMVYEAWRQLDFVGGN